MGKNSVRPVEVIGFRSVVTFQYCSKRSSLGHAALPVNSGLIAARPEMSNDLMAKAKQVPADDILTCSKCGGQTMLIYVEEHEVQSVKCATCGNLVAYTSNLIRILDKT
jgi:hypothetical protein